MTISMRRGLATVATLALLVMPVAPVWTDASARGGGGAARGGGGGGGHASGGRSGGGGGGHAGGSHAAPSSRPSGGTATRSTASRSHPPQTASGTATYGHGSGGYYGGGYPWYGYGYGYPYWSLDFYWGWGWPWYGSYYPYYPYYPSEPVDVYSDLGPGRVEIDVSPRKATILLDGEPAGRVKDWDGRWDRLPVDPGERVLTFEAPGYKTLRVHVAASSGGQYHVAYDLAAGEGIDSRSTSAEARAPERPPAAAADLNMAHAPEAPSPSLVKGFLRIHITPADAAVYLDGEYFARADELARLRGAVPLIVGTHAIEAVRPGYENGKVDVEIAADKPAEVALDLQKRP